MAEEGGEAADAPGSLGRWEEAWLAATAAAKRVVRPTKLFPMLSFCAQRRDARNKCPSRWKGNARYVQNKRIQKIKGVVGYIYRRENPLEGL